MLYLETEGFRSFGKCCFQKNGRKFFILPLCRLEELRDLRKETRDYDSPVIFLISAESEMPAPYNKKMPKDHRKELFGNPEFGNISKAILSAEIITTTSKDSNVYRSFQNVVKVLDKAFPENVIKLLKNREDIAIDYGKYRQEFYKTFVEYYHIDDFNLRNIDPRDVGIYFKAILDKMVQSEFIVRYVTDKEGKKKETELYKKLSKLNGHDVDSLITCADIIHCYLNDINYNDFTHRVDHELFRAPIPFPLQELIDAKKDIESTLDKKTIKLLLIDNKLDKIIAQKNGNESCEECLISVLFNEEVCSLFELTMLEDWVYDGIKRIQIPKEKEKFDSKKFKKDLHKIFTADGLDRKENYAWKVYEKIKQSHFVLLDFFLNQENTYLAFNFIEDICKIKRAKKHYSTTWFFITSAVYDSVVKYSQSGLLAEYYESAVVSAGDDPTNERRQIIFLYKLLTFINARLKNFCNLQKIIYDRLLKEDANCEYWNKEEKCKKNGIKCLEKEMLVVIRRYLNEFNDVKDIFSSNETEIKKWQDILESLDNVIKQFIWLPEADWYMIQHQIDFINNKLGGLQDKNLKKCKFSCKYILKELEDRSEVY